MQEPQGINSQNSVNTRWQNTTQRYHTQDSTTLALYATEIDTGNTQYQCVCHKKEVNPKKKIMVTEA